MSSFSWLTLKHRYDLELWTVPGPIRSGLASALESHPDVKAILMGTRRSDPYAANLQAFQVCIVAPLPLAPSRTIVSKTQQDNNNNAKWHPTFSS